LESITLVSNDSFVTGDEDGSLRVWNTNSLEISFLKNLKTFNENSPILFYQKYFLLIGLSDGTLETWQLSSFNLFNSFRAHNSKVTCLANVNNRNLFASSSVDSQIKIWDSNFQLIQTLSHHSRAIIALTYWESTNSLVSTSVDMKLNFYSGRNIKLVDSFQAHNRSVQDMAILDHETYLIATCSGDKTIKIWNNSLLLADLTDHIDYVYSLEYSAKNKILISCSRDNSIKFWNTTTFTLIETLFGHEDSVISLALVEDSSTLISGSCDTTILIWNLTTYALLKTLRDHTGCVNALNIYYKNKFLLSGSEDKNIFVWDIENNFKLIDRLIGHEGKITSVKSFGMIAASASEDKTIKIWHLNLLKISSEIKQAHKNFIWTICVIKNSLIATASADGTIQIWKKSNESSLQYLTTLKEHTNTVWALVLLRNNSLVSGSWDNSIKVWNQKNETWFECVATLNQESGVSFLTVFSSLLISGHWDGSIQIRNQTSLNLLQTLKQHSSIVWTIVLLNNGNLVSGSKDIKIIVWQKINETKFELRRTLT